MHVVVSSVFNCAPVIFTVTVLSKHVVKPGYNSRYKQKVNGRVVTMDLADLFWVCANIDLKLLSS